MTLIILQNIDTKEIFEFNTLDDSKIFLDSYDYPNKLILLNKYPKNYLLEYNRLLQRKREIEKTYRIKYFKLRTIMLMRIRGHNNSTISLVHGFSKQTISKYINKLKHEMVIKDINFILKDLIIDGGF